MEAQRFPEDYDGIIAGAPAYHWTALFTNFVWNAQALAKPGAAIPAAKTAANAGAVLAQCDAKDGLPDGLVGDPPRCRVDMRKLQCTGAFVLSDQRGSWPHGSLSLTRRGNLFF